MRQHPRDLFDIKILFESGGVTNEIRQAFVIYLAGNGRPIHELLAPNRLIIKESYEDEFLKMTNFDVSLASLLDVREQLITYIQKNLSDNERQFLLSIWYTTI